MKLEPREIVRTQRRRKGMTQAELAEAAGLHRKTIYQFESGESDVSLGRFMKILQVLELSLQVIEESETKE